MLVEPGYERRPSEWWNDVFFLKHILSEKQFAITNCLCENLLLYNLKENPFNKL